MFFFFSLNFNYFIFIFIIFEQFNEKVRTELFGWG